MFCRLKFKNADITNKCDVLRNTFVGILTGTITNANQLSTDLFETANSDIIEGSYGLCSWENIYSDTTRAVLRKESTVIPGKYKYLQFYIPDPPTNSQLYLETGNGFNTNSVTQLARMDQYITTTYAVNRYAYFSASNDFMVAANFAHTENNFIAPAFVEGFNWPYEQYSLEGRMKIIRIAGSTGITVWDQAISYFYSPHNNNYSGSISIGQRCVGLNFNIGENIGYTKESDLTTESHVLVPFVPRVLEQGWAGGNLSAVCGYYLGTSIITGSQATVDIGGNTYQIIRPYISSSSLPSTFYLRH